MEFFIDPFSSLWKERVPLFVFTLILKLLEELPVFCDYILFLLKLFKPRLDYKLQVIINQYNLIVVDTSLTLNL